MNFPHTCYLQRPQTVHFIEFSGGEKRLRVRRGMVGRPCLVFELEYITEGRALENYQRLVSDFRERGFQEKKTPPEPIVEGSKVGELFTDEMGQEYDDFFKLGWLRDCKGDGQRVFHLADGLSFQGDLDFEEFADMELSIGLIISGDVDVSGVLSQNTYTYPGGIWVRGNVQAQSFIHADSHMVIEGDLKVQNTVYGYYNDGSLAVKGEASGEAWISSDHDMWAGRYQLPCVHDMPENGELTPKVLDFEGSLDSEALHEYIREGRSPLRKGFKFTPDSKNQSPEEPEQTEPVQDPVVVDSQLKQKIQELAMNDDTEGMVELLEAWPERNDEWELFVSARIGAPSSTKEQKTRLKALLGPQPSLKEMMAELKSSGKKVLSSFLSGNLDEDDDEDEDEDEYVAPWPKVSLPKPAKDKNYSSLLKRVKKLNKKASSQQNSSEVEDALSQYEEVLAKSEAYAQHYEDDFGYDYLFALQGRLWCVNELVEQEREKDTRAVLLAQELLDFTSSQEAMYYSGEGELLRGSQVLAHNSLAWYELGNDEPDKALEHVNQAIEELGYEFTVESIQTVLKNKVKILLALENHDEAYALVYQVRRRYQDLTFFDDLAESAGFQKWDGEN